MVKVGDLYANQSGAQYKVIYVTPTSTAVPVLEQWVFLVLERRPFLDIQSQRFVTIPVQLVDRYFTGVKQFPTVAE